MIPFLFLIFNTLGHITNGGPLKIDLEKKRGLKIEQALMDSLEVLRIYHVL